MRTKILSRRWLINLLLIVLISIFIYVGNQSGNQPINSITRLNPGDIHTVIIETTDSNFVLRKPGTQWQFEEPLQWPANNITLERLISIAKTEPDSRLDVAEIDLAALGLKSPRTILTLNDTRIVFGTTNNIGGRRYIMIGSTVYLLPDIHLHFIGQGIRGLIDRHLIPRSLALKSLKLVELSLSKNSNGIWQGEAQAAQLDALANNWQTLPASRIKNYDSSKVPIQKMLATLENGSEIDFFLIATTPEIIIARPDLGVQYHFAEKQYYELLSIAK